MTQNAPQTLSPVFARGEHRRPRVTQPNSPLTVPLGLAGAVVLGFFVFSALSGERASSAQARAATNHRVAPLLTTVHLTQPAVALTSVAPDVAPPIGNVNDSATGEAASWRAPAMVVSLNDPETAPLAPAPQVTAPATRPQESVPAEDQRFGSRDPGARNAARAYQMRNLNRTIPQGAVIPAVLETALDSDLAGSVRAVVSRDVRSFDGSQVLVPRGSKLIGQYNNANALGQTRAFVIWSRILTPTGVSIDVASPAIDPLGRNGLPGEVNTHFFQRFGASILLSVLSAGLEAATAQHGGTTAVVIGSPAQASRIADIALEKQINIPTTIRVAQGTPVQVFVSRDLDFSTVPQ